jgi:hypothetical protein
MIGSQLAASLRLHHFPRSGQGLLVPFHVPSSLLKLRTGSFRDMMVPIGETGCHARMLFGGRHYRSDGSYEPGTGCGLSRFPRCSTSCPC